MFLIATATTAIYTLSLHDALPICYGPPGGAPRAARGCAGGRLRRPGGAAGQGCGGSPSELELVPGGHGRELEQGARSEEHTSELQSQSKLVCRLLLEKKNK